VRGFFMGAADVVPGVSGGTIALVLGIYERLIASVRAGSSALGHLLRWNLPGVSAWLKRIEWGFIIPLLGGILLAILALAGILESLLEDYPVQLAGLFLGLIAGSVVIVWGQVGRWDATRFGILIGVATLVFLGLGLQAETVETATNQVDDPILLAYFFAGAIAICAMILPGVSGSFLLVVLGMYAPVLAAVNDRDIATLLIFVLGTIVGLALFSQLLYWALRRHHDAVIAALIGLMIGSVRILWPWPNGLDSTAIEAPGEATTATVGAALLGFTIVVGIGLAARRIDRSLASSGDAPAPQTDPASGSSESDGRA
jgi:putative membrane protein